jgi:hypothetical protein
MKSPTRTSRNQKGIGALTANERELTRIKKVLAFIGVDSRLKMFVEKAQISLN